MARTSGRTSDRAKKKRKAARRRARIAAARATTQMLVVLVGGAAGGGMVVLAAFPETIDPIPSVACVGAAGTIGLLTVVMARRLRPYAPPR